jgi:hypothetical protein
MNALQVAQITPYSPLGMFQFLRRLAPKNHFVMCWM